MSSVKLQGMGVALITPFRHDKTIDFPALERLVEHQIASGIDFLVVLGTTAEAATLTKEERHQVQEFVKQKASGRVPLILGWMISGMAIFRAIRLYCR